MTLYNAASWFSLYMFYLPYRTLGNRGGDICRNIHGGGATAILRVANKKGIKSNANNCTQTK